MKFEATIAVLFILVLLISLGFGFKRKLASISFIGLVLIFVQLWASYLFSATNPFYQILSTLFSSVFLGPLAYLFLLSIVKKRNSKKKVFWHLALPTILMLVQFYNLIIAASERIEISIITNAIADVLNIIYGLVLFRFLIKIDSFKSLKNRILYFGLTVSLILMVLIFSTVSIIALLYFTDDLDLAKMAVEAPKSFQNNIKIWLLALVSTFFCWFSIKGTTQTKWHIDFQFHCYSLYRL